MDPERAEIAKFCLKAAHDGSQSFPQIIGKLLDAGFEGYAIDYRRNSQIFYLPDGDTVELALPQVVTPVAPAFDDAEVGALVRWAQANGPDYSFRAFCEKATAAGCAGYLVSIPGRRVVYYGRTAETHVELFPQ
ncbi:hypothetical protein BH09PSE4_BH09PSE4_04100 [soil metagenome]